jgi:hypothetical protein
LREPIIEGLEHLPDELFLALESLRYLRAADDRPAEVVGEQVGDEADTTVPVAERLLGALSVTTLVHNIFLLPNA